MKVLDVNFCTIRAAVAVVAGELKKTTDEKRIVFGPGFTTPSAEQVEHATK